MKVYCPGHVSEIAAMHNLVKSFLEMLPSQTKGLRTWGLAMSSLQCYSVLSTTAQVLRKK